MYEYLQKLPKCEHHIHLEGALTPELLFSMAQKNHIDLPEDDPAFLSPESLTARYRDFSCLDDFLGYYYIGMNSLLDVADFEALAWDYFQHAAQDGVAHAECFFDPQAHVSRGVGYDVVLSGFKAAQKRAQAELGISSELICCFLRHLPPPEALETLRSSPVQTSMKSGDVIGIGLDSSEKDFPPQLFQQVYDEARALGLRCTAHAGEEGPAEYIATALDDLRVQRIDHGVRLAEDPKLMQRIANDQTLLTICPISNVYLKCVTSVAELPIRTFLDAGVQFSINSDDPAYFGDNYILANYRAVQDAFSLTPREWAGICRAGIKGSWCDETRKKELMQRVQSVLDEWVARHDA
ncbi:adenine deaminase [Recurvomyces mirabilis]|uniref:Adenine deaminase n=1 Tax=Recurvomyces mirabilis TaxID=574656 RepID=A0AAE1C5F5_9PEZI|nr:adenine deaminase [Recurvomyces mirabilis]KAK5161222.1 adenine deaminase [Recurvomyces mirabilis]